MNRQSYRHRRALERWQQCHDRQFDKMLAGALGLVALVVAVLVRCGGPS